MPSNEQRRQAAKRKLERQLQRRAEQAKRRRMITIGATVAVVVVVVVGVFYFTGRGDDQPSASPSKGTDQGQRAKAPTSGPCGYQPTPEPAAKPVDLPPDPKPTPSEGTVNVTMRLGQGDVGLTLDRAKAPCTVQSFEHLVKAGYFDDTECHRLSTSNSLSMLQCGDPSGSGSGGPGYQIKDEVNPGLTYPRGTLAMAKSAQPNSGGSQFFLVFGDSELPPEYTVFGRVDEAGLKVLDGIAAKGTDNSESPGAGKPNEKVRILKATAQA